MLGEGLASRFEFATQATEDKLGRHMSGRRIADGQPVVLTVLDPQLKVGPAEVATVIEASRRLAVRKVPGILHCIEAGRTEGGNIYLLSESSPYETLKSILRSRNNLSLPETLLIAYRIAAILAEGAEAGVNHLDLSSSCIHVDVASGAVRIARYGYSRLLPTYAPTRKNEPYHGTAEYMAPEVCSGKPGDAAADLYALGILMYEMVAGKPPFVSSSPSTTIKRQVYEKPLPLHLVKPGTPKIENFEKLVTRLVSKDPKARPASARETMDLLAELAAEAFPEVTLTLEPPRAESPEVVLKLEIEAPQAAAMPVSHETMAFTGLSAAAIAAELAAAKASEATQAFDAEAVSKAAKPADATQAFEVGIPTQAFDASVLREPEPVPPAEEKTVLLPSVEARPIKKPEDWFVEGGQLPESALPEEEKREYKMFWVVALALGILLLFFGVVYFEASQGTSTETSSSAPTDVAPTVAPAPAPAPPTPSAPSPEQMKAERLRTMVGRGKEEFEKGNLEVAKRILEEVVSEDPGNSEAKGILAAIGAKAAATIKEPPREPPQPTPPPAPQRPAMERPAPPPRPVERPTVAPKPKAEQPAPPVDQERLKGLIKAGRDAYNRGDFGAAISAYNEALKMDPNNGLVQKLLEQAKAKANQ